MTGESDNFASPEAEIKTTDPSTDIDNPANLNFEDLDDDQDNQEVQAEDGNEPETVAAEETGQETENQPEEAAEDEDPVITLKGGEQVKLSEMKSGYMRDADYRQKTQNLANERRTLEDMSGRVTRAAQALADSLASQLPPEPDFQLAVSNPALYAQQKAIYDASLQNIQKILTAVEDPKSISQQISQQDQEKRLRESRDLLERAFPQIKTKEGNEKFFADAFETGRDFGFSEQEMQAFDDARYLKVIHYARLGMQAEKAREKALTKVANAPQAVSAPRQRQNMDAQRNKEAMRNLQRSGSIRDAMMIDFE